MRCRPWLPSRDGAQSMVAVARAEGDITGFNRLAPSVHGNNTNREIRGANQLGTGMRNSRRPCKRSAVHGRRSKRRDGDAREDIIGAIFEGTKIGTTFNEAQEAVGKFLASDSFKNFTDAFATGAPTPSDIQSAHVRRRRVQRDRRSHRERDPTALQDGAHYVYDQIKAAFAGTLGESHRAFDRVKDFFRGAGSTVNDLLSISPAFVGPLVGKVIEAFGRDEAADGREDEAAAQPAAPRPR